MLQGKVAKLSWLQHGWWVAASCCLIGLIYLHAIKNRNALLHEMVFCYSELEKEYVIALQEKEELQMRISSQNDPAWIEMVLMREIGVVPEGWIKVHFKGS